MRAVYDTNNRSVSRAVIDKAATAALVHASGDDRMRMQEILVATTLDEIHALVAEGLGDSDTAYRLRARAAREAVATLACSRRPLNPWYPAR